MWELGEGLARVLPTGPVAGEPLAKGPLAFFASGPLCAASLCGFLGPRGLAGQLAPSPRTAVHRAPALCFSPASLPPDPAATLGPVPVNTSPLTCTFLPRAFSCFDETLHWAVQVPRRGPGPGPGLPVIQEPCSRPRPHAQRAPQPQEPQLCEWCRPCLAPVPKVPVAATLSPSQPTERGRIPAWMTLAPSLFPGRLRL